MNLVPKSATYGREQTYGAMFQVKVLSQPILVINSHRIATELMTEREQIYSGRPFLPMINEVGWGRSIALLDSDHDSFRHQRRIFHRSLEGRKVDKASQSSL
jgi:hypothetical protein